MHVMIRGLTLLAAVAGIAAVPTNAADTSSGKGKDPNEKICEDIIPVGSRLAVKRVCATRNEWAEKRRRDRNWIDEGQRRLCVKGSELCP